jgi:ribosomal-protein-alanine N-acetyltransferase
MCIVHSTFRDATTPYTESCTQVEKRMKYLLKNQETERILFREIRKSDFNNWLEFHKNPNTSLHWISELESPKTECEKWYEKQFYRYENNLGGMNALIEKVSGKLIGHCGLLIQNVDKISELEIGYSLLPEFWNKGFATESAKKCRDYAFENNLSNSIISIISLTNKSSETVAIKNGMKIDKVTEYSGNKVNIYRIEKTEWNKIKPVYNTV